MHKNDIITKIANIVFLNKKQFSPAEQNNFTETHVKTEKFRNDASYSLFNSDEGKHA